VDGFQEFTVIMPWLSTALLRRIKHFQHDQPIALRHSRQHVRVPDAGHAVIRTRPDSGIRQKRMSGIPSTRPSLPRRAFFQRFLTHPHGSNAQSLEGENSTAIFKKLRNAFSARSLLWPNLTEA
jgi:hypothetical protein